MSSHESKSWIDTWWPLLVILLGVTFILTLALFHPHF
jgi:steroid 5-alpha reductase family enzyme